MMMFPGLDVRCTGFQDLRSPVADGVNLAQVGISFSYVFAVH